jgi:transcriptional regulator with XRE-family HTH domain
VPNTDSPDVRLKVLGSFLRAKRRSILPKVYGITTSRRRLVPGLSREETATLANLGASWYARLEAGHVPAPSLSTMRAVSQALRLSPIEVSFAFELAGILSTDPADDGPLDARGPISEMLASDDLVAMSLWDRFLAPIGWNALGDAMYRFSSYASRIERNPIVRIDDAFVQDCLGDAYEAYARNIVGIFRRAYSTRELTPYAREVFERGNESERFRRYWSEHVVADSVTPDGVRIVRHHPAVGTFTAIPMDLMLPKQQAFLRILSAADAESREKFKRLQATGRIFDPQID